MSFNLIEFCFKLLCKAGRFGGLMARDIVRLGKVVRELGAKAD